MFTPNITMGQNTPSVQAKYEEMFGLLLFLASTHQVATYEEGEVNVMKYVKTIAQNLEDLRKQRMISQSTLLDQDTPHKTWGLGVN